MCCQVHPIWHRVFREYPMAKSGYSRSCWIRSATIFDTAFDAGTGSVAYVVDIKNIQTMNIKVAILVFMVVIFRLLI